MFDASTKKNLPIGSKCNDDVWSSILMNNLPLNYLKFMTAMNFTIFTHKMTKNSKTYTDY